LTSKRLQKADNLLLSGGRGVELAAHFREASVNVIPEVGEVSA
jgi:hypothetical protein